MEAQYYSIAIVPAIYMMYNNRFRRLVVFPNQRFLFHLYDLFVPNSVTYLRGSQVLFHCLFAFVDIILSVYGYV